MKCSDLQPNDEVVFNVKVYAGDEKEDTYDGTVLFVNKKMRTVTVCYLEGYKSRTDDIPFEKMLAKADENGEEMLFGGWIRGNSVLLEAE